MKNMEKGKGKLEIPPPSGRSNSPDDQGNKLQSSKQSVIMDKGKGIMIEPPKRPKQIWESMHMRSHSKGIVIGPPTRSPLPINENEMVSTKSQQKTSMELRPLDKKKVSVIDIPSSPERKKRRRRNKQKKDIAPSCGRNIYPQDVIDAGMHLNPDKKIPSAWFILTPSDDQKGKDSLQILPEPYVQVFMDPDYQPDVSTIMKSITWQLNHVKAEEIGIFMNGEYLSPEIKLVDVVKRWRGIVGSERKITKIGGSAKHFCVKLDNARNTVSTESETESESESE